MERRPRPDSDIGILLQLLDDIELMETLPAPRRDLSVVPEGLASIRLEMTNFDHSIDEGLDEALRAGGVKAIHSAWNFNGTVWFAGGLFHEEVWVYRVPQEVISAPTLRELMNLVNEKYGGE